MANASIERELKLEVPDEFSLVRLEERLGPYRLSAPELHRLHTTYYDTEDLRLARWGASLRYRQGEGWTLKLPEGSKNGAVYRMEHTFTGESGRLPDAALDLVSALLRGRQPSPLADLRTVRTQRDVRTARGAKQLRKRGAGKVNPVTNAAIALMWSAGTGIADDASA